MSTRPIVEALIGRDCKRELVAHQIDSYDDFIENRIEDVVSGFNPIRMRSNWDDGGAPVILEADIVVTAPRLVRPTVDEHDGSVRPRAPDVARARHFTYAGDLLADIEIAVTTTRDGASCTSFTRTFASTKIGRIPIMVYSTACAYRDPAARTRSNMCVADPGGYFVIGGNERVVVPQDRMSENRIFVFPVNKTVSYTFGAEVRSLVSERFGVPKLVVVKVSAKTNVGGHFVHVTMHHINANIPLFILMRALGATTDRSIYDALHGRHAHGDSICNFLSGCSHDCMAHRVASRSDALAWIASRCASTPSGTDADTFVRAMLETELLPHVGPSSTHKRIVLADMARRAALVAMGITRTDDRDSYANKRVDPAGILLANLFRQCYGKFAKEARKSLAKDLSTKTRVAHKDLAESVHVGSIARPAIIEAGMRAAMATGNWGMKNNAKVGVSQILSRITYAATISHLRRVCTSLDKTSKLVHPRKLHSSQWGVFCPAETPEGHSVGVVKNMALGVRVTLPVDPAFCVRALRAHSCGRLLSTESRGVLVSVNYAPIGRVAIQDADQCLDRLRAMRRCGTMHAHASIVHDRLHGEVRVLFDGGRLVRPLLVVRRGALPALEHGPKADWTTMVTNGEVEYLDIEEANDALIAMRPGDVTEQHTHCEIHPALALGVLASMIPFPDHNQSPRNSYQSAMGKQAIGVFATNFRHRFDTHAMVLNYGQRPVVSAFIPDLMCLNALPSGANLIVAVSTMAGYNQEDSVVLNQSSLERGMFATTVYHNIYEQIHKNPVTGEEEVFYAPSSADVPHTIYNFDKLTPSGFPDLECQLSVGDIVIGKFMPQKNGGATDESVALRTNEGGKLDILVSALTHGRTAVNGDGYAFCQARLRDTRTPTIGDKVASRAGQKGTVGLVLRQEDMPVTDSGLVPDLVINPHALPSRMTVGQVLEGVLGKACCMVGRFGDASPFDGGNHRADDVFAALQDAGAERNGEEVVYDPRTGKQTQCTMFITPTYYQRLKHMVTDKVHGRGASGPMVLLTRQPAEGRARDGGLRLGEMEIECLLAHGQMKFLKERFMHCSDGFEVDVCALCGAIACVNIGAKLHTCKKCGNARNFRRIGVPFAMKLMIQEIEGLGVATSLCAK